MAFKGKRSFFKAGSVTALLGAVLNIIGFIYLPYYWLSSTYPSDIYWTNTINLVGIGLILTGLVIIIIGTLRED